MTVRVLRTEAELHDLIRALLKHPLEGQFHNRSIVGMHQCEHAGPHGDVVVVAKETLSPGTVLSDRQIAIDDDDEVGGRGENGLGHFDVRGQCGRVRVSDAHVSTSSVNQVTASLRRPFNPTVRSVTTTESALESRAR